MEKKITKRPSEQPLPYVAPLSPKQPKIIVHPSEEEVLPSEEDGMAKKEKLSEESKKSPLSSANSLSPTRKNPISTHTPVSMNGSQSMPCTSSLKVVETKSPIKSSQLEVELEVQRESEVEAPSYIAVPDPSVLKQGFSKDPETWSVDEVIQFMKHKDPQKSGPLADLFRQHEIDGKALLLLKSDVIMKYMGLKLGPALKLCYYIEKLKEGKYN
ncbi:PREDICTED: sex comb on midleg-like protein 2 [Bison bison bison]|uniref:Sex comb on midleg-like protein 2 n=1 Tax=Bison bison bison TaxID=43346 RepID=A0A6P3HG14_BISBB|nr:PREDICTED: sex comb on midleg-like protein 2 [Bison bison bison]